jgi:uncharacterized membrane protein YqaE (UPF0057 family)
MTCEISKNENILNDNTLNDKTSNETTIKYNKLDIILKLVTPLNTIETINLNDKNPKNIDILLQSNIHSYIDNYISTKYNKQIGNFFIIFDNKIISRKWKFDKLLNEDTNTQNTAKSKVIKLEIITKLIGGGLIDMFMGIIKLGEFFFLIPDIIMWFLKMIPWTLNFITWFWLDFANPYKLATDFSGSLIMIVTTILSAPIDICFALFAFGANTIGNFMTSIWGWDQSHLTTQDKESKYFQEAKKCGTRKCYLTQKNTIPFSVILGTIICPPLGVFMEYGATGWLNILICTLLTLLLYIPGLFYALLIIYS